MKSAMYVFETKFYKENAEIVVNGNSGLFSCMFSDTFSLFTGVASHSDWWMLSKAVQRFWSDIFNQRKI